MRKRNRSALLSDASCLEKPMKEKKTIRSMSACHYLGTGRADAPVYLTPAFSFTSR